MSQAIEQMATCRRWQRAVAAGVVCISFFVSPQPSEAGTLLSTGFEQAKVVPSGKPTHDLLSLRLPSGQTGRVGIQYEGGTPADRQARVIDDPTKAGNRVLEYALLEANAPGQRAGRKKGRIQMNLVGVKKDSVYQHFRMYLHPDLAHYRTYPKPNTWFTINELWAGAAWEGANYPFRISLDIVKESGVGPLRLAATGSERAGGRKGAGRWRHVWADVNRSFELPVGEWLDVEVGYKQGDEKSGRFYVAVTPASSKKRTEVLDVTNWTYHPKAPKPVPLTHWQPLKLYTSSNIIDHVSKRGGAVRVYWDDLRISDAWPG